MTESTAMGAGPKSQTDLIKELRQQLERGAAGRNRSSPAPEPFLLNSILQSISFPLYVIDAATYEVLLANSATCPNGQPDGATCYELTHHQNEPCNGSEGPCPLQQVKITKSPVVTEHIHYDRYGRARYVEIHAFPVFDDAGTVTQMIEYNVDITERKRIEEDLRNHQRSLELLVHELERSNKELQEFTSIAAHDIRSPMASILTSAALLQESLRDRLNQEEQNILDILIRGIDRTTDMIGALYRCCQVDSTGISYTDVDLNAVIEELHHFQLQLEIQKTGATLHIPQPLHRVRGDQIQILGLMQNLIGNALKYRRSGVPPRVVVRSTEAGDNRIRIEVEDNGIGIREADQERIFDMFQRLDDAQGREGLGIGLSFCKRITQRHGGRIGVRSTHGAGSTFWVELPSANR